MVKPEIIVNVNMSLRDYFAGLAMQGILANVWRDTAATPEEISEDCYEIADAMLKARED